MAGNGSAGRWRRMLRYSLGGLVCLSTLIALRAGLQWYWSVVLLSGALLILLGRRRIFRPSVDRGANDLVCRYVPWYEGNAYFLNLALPLIGVASISASYAPGNPRWLLFSGSTLLCVTPLFTFAAVRMWRRCYLRISPSALIVQLAAPKDEPIELRREFVESIMPKIVPNGVSGESLQVEIAYRTANSSGDEIKTVLLGLQLSIKPINLLNALAYWEDAADDEPSALLDRVERILRGRVEVADRR